MLSSLILLRDAYHKVLVECGDPLKRSTQRDMEFVKRISLDLPKKPQNRQAVCGEMLSYLRSVAPQESMVMVV